MPPRRVRMPARHDDCAPAKSRASIARRHAAAKVSVRGWAGRSGRLSAAARADHVLLVGDRIGSRGRPFRNAAAGQGRAAASGQVLPADAAAGRPGRDSPGRPCSRSPCRRAATGPRAAWRRSGRRPDRARPGCSGFPAARRSGLRGGSSRRRPPMRPGSRAGPARRPPAPDRRSPPPARSGDRSGGRNGTAGRSCGSGFDGATWRLPI